MLSATTSSALEVLRTIDSRIASRHLLGHPFYQAWTAGTLSREALRDYAAQYYHHVAAFPTYLSAVHAQTDDLALRRHILANLIDEEAGSPNHPELWMQFANRFELSKEEISNVELWPETKSLIERFRNVCGTMGTAAGLSALYAYESQVPEVAESKIAGLKRFYHCTDPQSYEYFRVHIEADREHSSVEKRLLAGMLNSENEAASLRAVDEVLDGLWQMLSAVCSRHAICN